MTLSHFYRFGGNIYNGTFIIKLEPDRLSKIQSNPGFAPIFLFHVRSQGIYLTSIQQIYVLTFIKSLFTRYICEFEYFSYYQQKHLNYFVLICSVSSLSYFPFTFRIFFLFLYFSLTVDGFKVTDLSLC